MYTCHMIAMKMKGADRWQAPRIQEEPRGITPVRSRITIEEAPGSMWTKVSHGLWKPRDPHCPLQSSDSCLQFCAIFEVTHPVLCSKRPIFLPTLTAWWLVIFMRIPAPQTSPHSLSCSLTSPPQPYSSEPKCYTGTAIFLTHVSWVSTCLSSSVCSFDTNANLHKPSK